MPELTPRERQVKEMLEDEKLWKVVPPSDAEIARRLGISKQAVNATRQRLELKELREKETGAGLPATPASPNNVTRKEG